MEQKIATHQLTQVKTMIRKNYNTKKKKYDIIALDILIFIETLEAEQSAFLLSNKISYDCSTNPILYQTFCNY